MLYHLTLHQATAVSLCVPGCFTSSERHAEVVLLRGTCILELWVYYPQVMSLRRVSNQELYGQIISMKPIRPPGAERDYLVANTKKGETIIFSFNLAKRFFTKVSTINHKSCRPSQRLGQFVTADPRGRAFILGAQENIKEVYSVKVVDEHTPNLTAMTFEENNANYRGLTYDIVCLDNTSDRNIVSFACTEVVFMESLSEEEWQNYNRNIKKLTGYHSLVNFDVNLSEGKVKLQSRVLLKHRSNFLMEVPAGNIGPGGVLIFSENHIVYKLREYCVQCPIPRRLSDDEESLQRPIIFINCTLYMNRGLFYYLAQTEVGDVFKITLASQGSLVELQMQYYCSLPLATALCILEPDRLFVVFEFGDQCIYSMSDFPLCDEPIFSSNFGLKDDETFFMIKEVRHLEISEVIRSPSPVIALPVIKHSLFALCRSNVNFVLDRVVQKLQIVTDVAEIKLGRFFPNKLTGLPTLNVQTSCVHAVQLKGKELIILSHPTKTVLFEVNDRTLSQVNVPDISTSIYTLACRVLKDTVVIQVYAKGIYTNCEDRNWKAPKNERVEACALNNVEAILLMNNNSLHYASFGKKAELEVRHNAITNVGKARAVLLSNDTNHADFALIGSQNESVYVISLNPDTMFQCVFTLSNLLFPINSLLFCDIGYQKTGKRKLLIGLTSGDLWTSYMEVTTGKIENTEMYHWGKLPIRLLDCGQMVMILSEFTWLYLIDDGKVVFKRIDQPVDTACNCSIVQRKKFWVYCHPQLRCVQVEDLNMDWKFHTLLVYKFKPGKIVANNKTSCLHFIEVLKNEIPRQDGEVGPPITSQFSFLNIYYPFIPPKVFGMEIHDAITCSMAFTKHKDPFLFLGSKKVSQPTVGVLMLVKINLLPDDQINIKTLDEVEIEGVPIAMEAFGAGVIIGIGKKVQLFHCSSNKIVNQDIKCECAATSIVSIDTNKQNILVLDSEKGFTILKFNSDKNELKVFAHNPEPASLCCFFGSCFIATADIYGNITFWKYCGLEDFILETEEDLWDTLVFKIEGPKAEKLAHFSVGENISSMQMMAFYLRAKPVLLYSTLSGRIGIIARFEETEVTMDYREDENVEKVRKDRLHFHKLFNEVVDSLIKLERFMLLQDQVLCQDHLTYRAPHYSLEGIIDGDFCERYIDLSSDAQAQFENFIKKTPEEIIFRLLEIRSNFIV